MKFDIKQLIVFIEVVEQSSFSKAAIVLGVAQASVSERIANLEKAVGAKLLNRLGRKVELTSTGTFLLKRAKEIVALKNKTSKELCSLLGVDHGEILVGGSTAPGEYILPKLMGQFAKDHPKVSISLEISDSQEIIEKIGTGAIEVGVTGRRETGDNLIYKKVWTDEIVLVVNPKHKWAGRRKPVSVDQLVNELWVVREPGSGTRATAEKMLGKKTSTGIIRENIAAQLGSVTAVKEAVMADLGIALISKVTVTRELEIGSLKSVKIDGFSAPRNFYLARDKRRSMSPAANAFWKFILKEADQ